MMQLQSVGGSQISGKSILNVASPFASISDDTNADSGRIMARIERAVVDAGAQSLVIASLDSNVCGTFIPVPTIKGTITPQQQQVVWNSCRQTIERVLHEYDVDLIHFHGSDFHRYLPEVRLPKLVTLQSPPTCYPEEIFAHARRRNVLLHCVSHWQRFNCPASDALLSTIPNGVEVAETAPVIEKSDFVFSIGDIRPEKGFHMALDAAKRADARMLLAGAVFDYERHGDYFESEIVPRLDDARQFIGVADKNKRQTLLSQARCVLVPNTVPEASSLLAMEALARGTPVVAFGQGALPEIVQDGVNGFIVNDVAEMADAIKFTATISPERCWETARCSFDWRRMTSAYLRRYEIIIRGCGRITRASDCVAAAPALAAA
jgi:glycosyltransferase involved in cell wall biosynthesis